MAFTIKLILGFCLAFVLLGWGRPVLAQSEDQFLTIVNPIRISRYTNDSAQSVLAEYKIIKEHQLPATWLLTYDALHDVSTLHAVLSMTGQQLGLFLEVTPLWAEASGVRYRKTDSWHRANSIFLSGYTQEERIKLLDILFADFYKQFGFFPKSVGAWWVDAYSLDYMQSKYHITSNLTVTDQFSTDGYQVWGQYWGAPFYPSKNHAGMPAQNINNQIPVVTMQWAPRDPLHGYGDGSASLFSIQDYQNNALKDDYMERLVQSYGLKHDNQFGQVVFGLEADLPAEGYGQSYARQIGFLKSLSAKYHLQAVTMDQFAEWYRSKFQTTASYSLQGKDYLGSNLEYFWLMTPYYRFFAVYQPEEKNVTVKDLRFYNDFFQEPYYKEPNQQLVLSSVIPSIIDTVQSPQSGWTIATDQFHITHEGASVRLDLGKQGSFTFTDQKIDMAKVSSVPETVRNSPYLSTNNSWIVPISGYQHTSISPQAVNTLHNRKLILSLASVFIFFCGIIYLKKRQYLYHGIMGSIVLGMFGLMMYMFLHQQSYFVSQSEVDALSQLSLLPGSKVLVSGSSCLQCEYHTKLQPAAFVGARGYVSTLSRKQLIQNDLIFKTQDRATGLKMLQSSGADYVYVTKYANLEEQLPFSPGDYHVERIYQNANAEIWRVIK